ncbi:hypothetical protein [Schaalia sp. ZJ1691]|uniref:hypothetical protein n=1 Tax=Schaalia sp. ZJ1691 TaxID=2709404 RepID=UPI0013E9C28B|nr:hypothetical protein [Schaalia sp. ZJ1691]
MSGLDGRGVPVDVIEDTGDKRKWTSGAEEFDNGVVRFTGGGSFEGSTRMLLDSPHLLDGLRKVLEGRGLVLITLSAPAEGVDPVRCVMVKRVNYTRTGTDGGQQVDVEWVEKPQPSGVVNIMLNAAVGLSGRIAPALTWGECMSAGYKWGNWTTIDALNRVTGRQG